jgi:hypothetical protein
VVVDVALAMDVLDVVVALVMALDVVSMDLH